MAPSTRTSRTAAETAATTTAPTEAPAAEATVAPASVETTEAPAEAPAATERRNVAQFVGHVGTERIITKADQDGLIGTKGVATRDLVWAPGNSKVDVSDVDEEVLAYLKGDPDFKVRELDVPVGESE